MVQEDNAGPESEKGPVLKPPRSYFTGLTVTRSEPFLFATCCEAFGIKPAQSLGYIFVIDEDGLTLLNRCKEAGNIPWPVQRRPSK